MPASNSGLAKAEGTQPVTAGDLMGVSHRGTILTSVAAWVWPQPRETQTRRRGWLATLIGWLWPSTLGDARLRRRRALLAMLAALVAAPAFMSGAGLFDGGRLSLFLGDGTTEGASTAGGGEQAGRDTGGGLPEQGGGPTAGHSGQPSDPETPEDASTEEAGAKTSDAADPGGRSGGDNLFGGEGPTVVDPGREGPGDLGGFAGGVPGGGGSAPGGGGGGGAGAGGGSAGQAGGPDDGDDPFTPPDSSDTEPTGPFDPHNPPSDKPDAPTTPGGGLIPGGGGGGGGGGSGGGGGDGGIGPPNTLQPDPETDPPRDIQGTGPVTVVPEPAAWVLMILGFGAVGYAIRRRSLAARQA